METLRITRVSHDDIPDVARILGLAGLSNWPDEALRFYASAGNCRSLIGRIGEGVIATGTAVSFGRTGWVGNIAVHPDHRRRGFGAAMTRAAMDWLEDRDVRTQLLLATPLGMPVYRRLGFVDEGVVYGSYATSGTEDSRTLRAPPASMELCARLDREATGEDRTSFLAAFPGRRRAVRVDDEEGYRLSLPWGGGPIVATGVQAARALLLDQLSEHPGSRVGFPKANASARALAAQFGWREVAEDTRMRRGEHLEGYRPDLIYGVFNFAVG